jgi:glycosyltransferase involved in cell wall biosynthesis
MNTLYIVAPCYNEEAVIESSSEKLLHKLTDLISRKRISEDSRILFVDDGSKDKTWEMMKKLHEQNYFFSAISFSGNRGHQNAIMAGLLTAKDYADCVITIDGDLQQDINAVDRFLDEFEKGNDIVYGVRNSRAGDGKLKKMTALTFYRLMKWLGCEILPNHADYRLMSKRAIEALSEYNEVNLFLRGLIPLIGFNSSIIYFDVFERTAGESKYTGKKMLELAVDGITSLSIKPIRMITMCGFWIFAISILMLIYHLVVYFTQPTTPGWPTIVISIWAIGGIQLLALGVIGEYIGRIYLETKHRPRYIVKEFLHDKGTDRDKG